MSDDEFDWAAFRQAMKERSQDRRANNRENSRRILEDHGVKFDVRNDGAHLLVKHPLEPGVVFDFWPGTGKWHQHNTKRYLHGVFPLLKRLSIKIKKEYGR